MNGSITIPTNIQEVTLRQWQRYMSIEEPTNEQVVEILCDVTPQEVLQLPSEVYEQAIERLSVVIPQVGNKHELVMRFEHKGKQYGMIPNLDKITYGANKDIVGTIDDWEKMHYAMNALYRPIVQTYGETYKVDDYKGDLTIDDLRDMPLHIVLGARLFFWSLTKALLKARQQGDAQSNYQRKCGSYDETFALAQGDIRRFDEVAKLPLHQCYMYLANNVDKIKLERRMSKTNK